MALQQAQVTNARPASGNCCRIREGPGVRPPPDRTVAPIDIRKPSRVGPIYGVYFALWLAGIGLYSYAAGSWDATATPWGLAVLVSKSVAFWCVYGLLRFMTIRDRTTTPSCVVPAVPTPRPLAKRQHLQEQARQRRQVVLAEVGDGAKVRSVVRRQHPKGDVLVEPLGDAP